MSVTYILFSLLSILFAILLYVKYKWYRYWTDRGVPQDKPHLIYGNMKGYRKTKHQNDIFSEIYVKYKHQAPFAGFYFFAKRAAVILDLDLVKNILIKDFNMFPNRHIFYNEKQDPLSAHIFAQRGDQWKSLRQKFTPTFTSGKMKYMFPTILYATKGLNSVFREERDSNSIVEIKDILSRYTTDVIGHCAFGIECNSLKDPKTDFRIYGNSIFSPDPYHDIITAFTKAFPKLARRLGLRKFRVDTEDFFMNMVKSTIQHREEHNLERKDFMNLLMELMKKDDGIGLNEVAAQCFIFFIAGFDTSSTTISFALYELAFRTDIQDKLRDEINTVLTQYDGIITYESLGDMTFLDQVINETLRKHSVLPFLTRIASYDYKVPGTDLTIEKGINVFIPIDAIHYDPDIYPEPEKFDPDRFGAQQSLNRHPMAFIPFGDGPRNCIGLRFGKMQTKLGIISLLREFKFSVCPKTESPVKLNPRIELLTTLNGMYLKCEKI